MPINCHPLSCFYSSTTKKRMKDSVLYRKHHSVKVGEINRFIIEYTPEGNPIETQKLTKSLCLKVRNMEALPLRAAYLMGPFIVYVDVRSAEYDHRKSCFITADQPLFEPNLQAGQSFYSELSLHTIREKYVWVVDISSQILFTDSTEVNFELLIGTDRDLLEKSNGLVDDVLPDTEELRVTFHDTIDLWNSPAPNMEKPIHLVVLTHGLYSNVGADMYFIKECIDKMAHKTGENILVKGYQGNVCKTEKGIKFLGKGVAEYIVNDLLPNYPSIAKISFIAHSLGGLIQTYSIAYLLKNYPDFFTKIKPDKFITLASPLLGIANENPAYVKLSLTVGVVGRTGQDLGLFGSSPLLLKLPKGPTHQILKMFNQRTVYANALHDGIVPLRTSALLYLDWRGLAEVTSARKNEDKSHPDAGAPDLVDQASYTENESNSTVAQIPETSFDAAAEEGEILPYITSKVLSPFQAMLSLCAPMVKQEHEVSKYKRYQTIREDDNEDTGPVKLKGIPKSSMIQSATKVLLPPLPSKKFICEPSSRENVILHDKVYQESDLPPKHFSKSPSLLNSLNPDHRLHKLEEEIARLWHKDMAWRKVLVKLQPDAHNNIIVRRRFANAYGWGVIEHLVNNHFSTISPDKDDEPKKEEISPDDGDDWVNDEEEVNEEAYDENAESSKKLDYGNVAQDEEMTEKMFMSGYYN